VVSCSRGEVAVYKEKTCLGCGKVFRPSSGNQTCCSRSCWLAQDNIKKNPNKFRARNCPRCGKLVENDPHTPGIRIFCSQKCYRAHYYRLTHQPKMAEEKACLQCGKAFVRNSAHQKFCSSICWHEHYNIRKHPDKYRERNCPICAAPVENGPHSRGKRLFCSTKCCARFHDRKQAEAKRRPIEEKSCLYCGKIFMTKYSFHLCCSKRCRHRYLKEQRNPSSYTDRQCPNCGVMFRQSTTKSGFQRYCCHECARAFRMKKSSDMLSQAQFERKNCITAFRPDRWHKQLTKLASEQRDDEPPPRRILLVLGVMGIISLGRRCEFVRYQLNADPCSGDLYVFCNSARSVLRYFEWDSTEFCVGYRRAHCGTFPWPHAKECRVMEISEDEWNFLLHKSARTLMRTNSKNR